MRQASTRFIGFSVNMPVRPAAERKRGALLPSRISAAVEIGFKAKVRRRQRLPLGSVTLHARRPIRVKARVITLISARSRNPTTQGTSLIVPSSSVTVRVIRMLSSSFQACSASNTVVFSFFTT
jgi:hypothetical protein